MQIKIICVGKIKEKFFSAAVDEYIKRIGKYSRIEVIEVREESAADEDNEILVERCMQREAEGILKNIKSDDFVSALCIEGAQISSIELAKFIETNYISRGCDMDFVIGGSYGLHETVKKRADFKLSFSKMTFPHQLMRVVLCEQIFRAFKIYKNEKYHK